MTSSVSPYLQRPVRKLEEVSAETKPTPTPARSVAEDTHASADVPALRPETPPND